MKKPIFNKNISQDILKKITETYDGKKIIGRAVVSVPNISSLEIICLEDGTEIVRDKDGKFAEWGLKQ